MTALETYLGTHLRYGAWAARRILSALAKLTPEEYLRELGGGLSARSILEQLFEADKRWYELLADEAANIEPPLNEDWYSIFANLELDYRDLLRQLEVLASFLDDLELALRFSQEVVFVPWLEDYLPKWQAAMTAVSDSTHRRGQLATLLRQLGHTPPKLGLAHFYLELEGSFSR